MIIELNEQGARFVSQSHQMRKRDFGGHSFSVFFH